MNDSSLITIATPSIPGREDQLADAIRSVYTQTVLPDRHLIQVQEPPAHMNPSQHLARQRQDLLVATRTRFIGYLDDDDVYLSHHIETIMPHLASAQYDVIYTYATPETCETTYDATDKTREELLADLEHDNRVASNAAIRVDALWDVGGWGHKGFKNGTTKEDWDLFVRLADAGARFLCLPIPTWEYRKGHPSIQRPFGC